MKALSESAPTHMEAAGLILLFDGEVGPAGRDLDEHNQTGILTPGLTSLPPSRTRWVQWLWEFVARYSGATVPDFHGVS